MHRARTKSLRISIVIVAAFLVWWTPYYTMMIILLFINPDDHVSYFDRNNRAIGLLHIEKNQRRVLTNKCLSAQRGTTERNIFLRYEQQLGKSFDIWRVSSLAAETTAGLLSKVNRIYETVRYMSYPFRILLQYNSQHTASYGECIHVSQCDEVFVRSNPNSWGNVKAILIFCIKHSKLLILLQVRRFDESTKHH